LNLKFKLRDADPGPHWQGASESRTRPGAGAPTGTVPAI
jgi:hypothetical protein